MSSGLEDLYTLNALHTRLVYGPTVPPANSSTDPR